MKAFLLKPSNCSKLLKHLKYVFEYTQLNIDHSIKDNLTCSSVPLLWARTTCLHTTSAHKHARGRPSKQVKKKFESWVLEETHCNHLRLTGKGTGIILKN